MPTNWTNSDGLYVKFGQNEATVATEGEYSTKGLERVVEVVLDLTTLATGAARIGSETATIPTGVRITKIKVINEIAATGSGALLNLGIQKLDRTTEGDYDGLLAVAPRTDWDLAGETKEYIIGVTGVGALVGTTTTYAGYLTADYDTAAFSAGKVRIQVSYYKP